MNVFRLTFGIPYGIIGKYNFSPFLPAAESMSFEIFDLRASGADLDAAVCRTVDLLREGKLVVLPTETVYGLAALASDAAAVERLINLKGRREGHPLPLAISGLNQLYDFASEVDPLALRLARRCWPGAVSLILDASERSSEIHRLPESVRKAVMPGKTVGFRVPHHPLTLTVLGELNEPIVLTSANLTGQPDATDAETAIAALGHGVDLVVDDGPSPIAKPSTAVHVEGNQFTVLREGAVKKETIKRLTARIILFVCTGNTCRSPMAERICEQLLADRLGCTVDQLENHGFVVTSAGISAGLDAPPSRYAVEAMENRELDLSDHRSQQLNETHVRFADHIFTMTRGHREAILSYWPSSDTRLCVLRTDGGDIGDPIGGSLAVYEACADQMEREIAKRLDEIEL